MIFFYYFLVFLHYANIISSHSASLSLCYIRVLQLPLAYIYVILYFKHCDLTLLIIKFCLFILK